MSHQNIKRIVITGGPCAGKTTAIDKAVRHFSELGYKVFTIPEVPTMFTKSGMNYLTKNAAFFYEGEKATLEIQLALEDKFYRMAQTIDRPILIIYDRGTLDISAYMGQDIWNEVISELGYTNEELMYRYDAVIHLRSTAAGAEEFYTLSTNSQRLEQADSTGLQIARNLDAKVYEVWKNHKNFSHIGNFPHFSQKVDVILNTIQEILGPAQSLITPPNPSLMVDN